MRKKAKLLDSNERLECDSKEDGIRVEEEDEQRSEIFETNFDIEFEGKGSVEKVHGLFLKNSVSRETDGILEGWSGKEKEEIDSGSGSIEDGVSQGSKSLSGANHEIENGKAELDFDLNYPISDVVTSANHGTGYRISNPIIVDSDSENSLSDDDDDNDRSYGALDVVGEESGFELEEQLLCGRK